MLPTPAVYHKANKTAWAVQGCRLTKQKYAIQLVRARTDINANENK